MKDFILRKGDIANYEGNCIVIPSWPSLRTGNIISHSIVSKLESMRIDYDSHSGMFEPAVIYHNKKARRFPLFSAHFFPNNQLPFVDSYILAVCYMNFDEEKNTPFSERASKTTANVISVARENNVQSLAFPIYMTGDQGGTVEEIAPAMINEFRRHLRSGSAPSEISLFAYDNKSFDKVSSLI